MRAIKVQDIKKESGMKKFSDRIKSVFSHFQAKLLLAFLVCTLLPLGTIGFIFYRVTYEIAEDKIMSSALLADDQLNVQMNDRIRQTENVADSIQYDMYTLSQTDSSSTQSLSVFGSVRNDISMFKTTFGYYHISIFLPRDQTGAGEGLYFYPLEELEGFRIPRQKRLNPGTDSIWFYHPDMQIPFILSESYTSRDVIVCCRILRDQGTRNTEYAYTILIDPSEFSDALSDTFSGTDITSYLAAEDGTIMAHSNAALCGTVLDGDTLSLITGRETGTHREEDINYHTARLDNGWYHVTEIPGSYIRKNTQILLKTIIFTLLVSLPLTVLVIIMISGNLTKRLKKLSLAMKTFHLGTSSPSPVPELVPHTKSPSSYDEIDRLGITFQNMQESLNQNMDSILELSLSEERLKYQLLQSQINPHFLYNILGSVKTCISLERLDTAQEMIIDLTRFYRLTLRKSGDLIAIKDELEIARLYLEMEKLCHKDSLSWEIRTEDGIQNFLICRFTLQPFLENSIQHGISRQTPCVHILLDVSYGDDTVIITIKDNGAGIAPRQLEELRATLKNKTVDYQKHFGIGNVNKRLSSPSFGSGTVQVESRLNEGTEIVITFEQMEESDEESNDRG